METMQEKKEDNLLGERWCSFCQLNWQFKRGFSPKQSKHALNLGQNRSQRRKVAMARQFRDSFRSSDPSPAPPRRRCCPHSPTSAWPSPPPISAPPPTSCSSLPLGPQAPSPSHLHSSVHDGNHDGGWQAEGGLQPRVLDVLQWQDRGGAAAGLVF